MTVPNLPNNTIYFKGTPYIHVGGINYHMLQGTLELCTGEGNMGIAFLVEYLHFNNPHSARLFNTSNEQDVLPAAIGPYCFAKGNKLCLINDDQMN